MDAKEQEFTQLVKQEKSTIYSVCLMFADERTEVEDLVQDCLINLWKGYSSFEGKSNVRTWLYRVCMNTCISFDRKRKHAQMVPLELGNTDFLTTASDSDSRQIQMLRKRIRLLGPFDRAIVLLWLEDLSYDEIAAIVGISVKNVSVRLVRIKEQLKNNTMHAAE